MGLDEPAKAVFDDEPPLCHAERRDVKNIEARQEGRGQPSLLVRHAEYEEHVVSEGRRYSNF